MYPGAHGPNSHWTEQDFGIVMLMGAQSVKLMPYHTLEDVARLRTLGVRHFTVRLPDSVWPGLNGTEYVPSYYDYCEQALKVIRYFHFSAGITDFQVDCEPNISWAPHGFSPWDYRAWLSDVMAYMRSHIPRPVRLGFPPVSFSPQYEPFKWLGPMIDTATAFDFLCVNSYWQSNRRGRENILAGPMTWRQFGGNVEWYHEWQPDMPLQVVEWGNSIHEQQALGGGPRYTPAQVDVFRMEQYPLYIEYLTNLGYIEAAHVFITGGTPDWQGFRVTPPVARAMASRTSGVLPAQSWRAGEDKYSI